MSVFTVSRLATAAEVAAEMDRRGEVIEKLETNLRHWREECGKLHSQIDRAKATARAEALQEAAALCAKHVSSDVWHKGGYMSTYLAERIRALIPAPLPPREENNG